MAVLPLERRTADRRDHLRVFARREPIVQCVCPLNASAIAWSIAFVVCLALAITWITTAENKFFRPSSASGDHYVNAVAYVASPLAVAIMAIALSCSGYAGGRFSIIG
jgi:hypothetical protein